MLKAIKNDALNENQRSEITFVESLGLSYEVACVKCFQKLNYVNYKLCAKMA